MSISARGVRRPTPRVQTMKHVTCSPRISRGEQVSTLPERNLLSTESSEQVSTMGPFSENGAGDAHPGATKPAQLAHPGIGSGEQVTPISRITSDADFAAALPTLLAADMLALDVETTGLDPRHDTLQLVQLATRDRAYLIDSATVDLALLTPLLETSSPTIVGHNLGFDLGFLHAAGLPIPDGSRLFDTLLASQVHDGGAHPTGAKTVDPSGAAGRGGKPVMVGYHTLAVVAHRWLGQVLDKSLQTSDWSGLLAKNRSPTRRRMPRSSSRSTTPCRSLSRTMVSLTSPPWSLRPCRR